MMNDYIEMLKFANKKIVKLEKDKAVLENIIKITYNDLLMRAEKDSDGYNVVAVGSSAWASIKRALREQL
jgi:hypothetical protein